MARTLIRNAVVVTMDPALGCIDRGDILIDGEKIAAVAPDIGAPDAQVVDGRDHVVFPGLVNAHIHTWEFPLRGIGANWVSKRDYHANMHQNLATRYTAADVRSANLLGALNQLNHGTTTIMDWCHIVRDPEMADAAIDGLEEGGVRAVFAHGTVKPPIREGVTPFYRIPFPRDEIRRLRTGRLASDDRLVTLAMAILGPDWANTTSRFTTFALRANTGSFIPRTRTDAKASATWKTACRGLRKRACSVPITISRMATASTRTS